MSFFEELGIHIILGVIPNSLEGGLACLEPEFDLIVGQARHQDFLTFREVHLLQRFDFSLADDCLNVFDISCSLLEPSQSAAIIQIVP